MPILKYEDLTHAELSALDRGKTVVFLAVGPLEQHGPHLPLGTDAFTAEFFSREVAERLAAARPDWSFVLFPTIFAGSDTLTYPGTIEIRPAVLRALLFDCCRQLAKDGFRQLVAVGAHGGPRHMVVLEEVAAKVRWRCRARMVSASARILYEILEGSFVERIAERMSAMGSPMSEAERAAIKDDYHGGLLETSLMLVAHPNLVKPVFKSLKPAILGSLWKLRRDSGRKVGEGLGYLGSPAPARPEIGRAVADVLLDGVQPWLEKFLDGENVYKRFRSKFYLVPIFRTDFKVAMMFLAYAAGLGVAISALNRFGMEIMR